MIPSMRDTYPWVANVALETRFLVASVMEYADIPNKDYFTKTAIDFGKNVCFNKLLASLVTAARHTRKNQTNS